MKKALTEIENEVGQYYLVSRSGGLYIEYLKKYVSYKYINEKIEPLDSINHNVNQWYFPVWTIREFSIKEINVSDNKIEIVTKALLNQKFKILDINGRLILSGKTSNEIYIGNLNPGIYFITINDKYLKFMVQWILNFIIT